MGLIIKSVPCVDLIIHSNRFQYVIKTTSGDEDVLLGPVNRSMASIKADDLLTSVKLFDPNSDPLSIGRPWQ